jgi:hypothetical protein
MILFQQNRLITFTASKCERLLSHGLEQYLSVPHNDSSDDLLPQSSVCVGDEAFGRLYSGVAIWARVVED